MRQTTEDIRSVGEEYQDIVTHLEIEPANTEELKACTEYMHRCQDLVGPLQVRFDRITDAIKMLSKFGAMPEEADFQLYWSTYSWPKRIQEVRPPPSPAGAFAFVLRPLPFDATRFLTPPPQTPKPPHGLGVCVWMHLVNGTGNGPSPGRPTPGVVKQDKSSRGSVATTTARLGPQRVRMSGGERPIGAAKGKQSATEALCQPPAPPVSIECLVQRTLPFGPFFFGTQINWVPGLGTE